MNSQNTSVLLINAIVDKNYQSELPGYLSSVMQVFGQHGGKPLARYKTLESLGGQNNPEMVAVLEFPNPESIKQVVKSDAFQALAETRARVFTQLNMMISTPL